MPVSHHSSAVARELDAVFTVSRMRQAWKKDVRLGLRRQPLGDLHDFMDVHRNLDSYLRTLRSEVLGGQYRPQPPEVTLLEKRDGIPRRLSMPSPGDAILLQTIVDVLEAEISKRQPHPNAYYSQSHSPPSIDSVDGTFAYPWWILWPQFQKQIWRFADTFPFVVSTDLANYFDSIPLFKLRNAVAAFGAFSETVLNFLFYLLDAFTWKPFYMPSSGVGLPQINFDAPRLLAHAYLFRLDEELERAAGGNFVRWMDDINFGAHSREEARKTLRGIEIVLNSMGIRINTGKTKILDAKSATEYYWIQENSAITVLTNLMSSSTPASPLWSTQRSYARKRYERFKKKPHVGQWDKVLKRYFTLFRKMKDPFPEKDVPVYLNDTPGMRGTICSYYTYLGPSQRRLSHLSEFLRSGQCLDDASLFQVVRVFVAWRGQAKGRRRDQILGLVSEISKLGTENNPQTRYTVSGVTSAIWLLAKYGSATELLSFLRRSNEVWTRSAWAARQAAAVVPLLDVDGEQYVRDRIVQSGLPEALRVLASIDQLRSISAIDSQLRAYLFHPPDDSHPYPLEKVVLLRVVLSSRIDRATRSAVRARIQPLLTDPSCIAITRRKRQGR